jgi:hypothetical protein
MSSYSHLAGRMFIRYKRPHSNERIVTNWYNSWKNIQNVLKTWSYSGEAPELYHIFSGFVWVELELDSCMTTAEYFVYIYIVIAQSRPFPKWKTSRYGRRYLSLFFKCLTHLVDYYLPRPCMYKLEKTTIYISLCVGIELITCWTKQSASFQLFQPN